jgi:hypothetical protein
MRLLAYPEIGRRITISQGRERTRRNRHCEKRSDEAIQGTQGARDSWIASSAFGLLATTILSSAQLGC